MDKILRPQIFETLLSLSNAIKNWRNLLATFEKFLQNTVQYNPDRRTVFLNFIGRSVYELIFGGPDNERAVSKLQQLYD